MQDRSHSHKLKIVMLQLEIPEGHHSQFQVNIRCHDYFQYIAFFGKDNFEVKPMFLH